MTSPMYLGDHVNYQQTIERILELLLCMEFVLFFFHSFHGLIHVKAMLKIILPYKYI